MDTGRFAVFLSAEKSLVLERFDSPLQFLCSETGASRKFKL